MKSTTFVSLCLLSLIALFSCSALGQPAIGIPPFSSIQAGPADAVNLGNLNVNLRIPIINKAGRGLPFAYMLAYDNSIWYPVTSGGTQTWHPVSSWGWQGLSGAGTAYISYSMTYQQGNCGFEGQSQYQVWQFSNFVYFDYFGLSHPFSDTVLYYNSPGGTSCPPNGPEPSTPQPSLATDNSGYTIYATPSQAFVSAYLIDKSGSTTSPPVSVTPPPPSSSFSQVDRNGNAISASNGTYTDTLGTTVFSVLGTAPSNTNLNYTGPSGTVSYVVKYKAYNIQTNFGCSQIGEYSASSVYLVDTVTLPDTSKYSFTYEATPGNSQYSTGRLQTVTLPTGGSMTYTYTGANDGVVCADGSTMALQRVLSPGGTWTYTRSGSGNAWTTTVDDPTTPTANESVINFSKDSGIGATRNFYETQRLVYQGLHTTGTLLLTTYNCWNNHLTGCATQTITAPIGQKDAYRQPPGVSAADSETFYNTYGLPTEDKEFDYGNTLVSDTVIAYSTLGNIHDRPSSVTVKDGSGNTVAQTTYTYDETSTTVTTGTPQHGSVSGARGNLTTLASQVNSTQTLYRKFTYYDTGTLNTSTDVSLSSTTNGATTTYVYGSGTSCGNSFPTQVNLPMSLSRTMSWNCSGGVQLTATDENANVLTATYSDPDFWRPAATSDELNNATNITYINSLSAESALTFNGGASTVDGRTKLDLLGRPSVAQQKQSPSSTTYDSVETDYDIVGRVSKATQAYAAAADTLCSGTCPGAVYGYDPLNRLSTITDGGGGTAGYTYTKNDILLTIGPAPSGEHSKSRQLEYDGLGRLTSVCEVTSVSGSGTCAQANSTTGLWTQYTYDPLNHLTGVTQNAQAIAANRQTRAYSFDRLGRMTSETNAENGTTTYVYDADATCGAYAGNLVKKTDAVGNVTCFAYDSLHRRMSITYPSGSYASATPSKYYVYDAATVNGIAVSNTKNRLAEAYTCTTCSPTPTKITDLWYSYSKRGETTDTYEVTPHSAGAYHLTQSYWAHGGLDALGGLPGLPTITYGASDGSGLDGEGRVTKISTSSGTNPLTAVSYVLSGTTQPIGSLTQLTLGSGDTDNFAYDPNTARMTQYKFNIGATPQTIMGNLTWNPNGSLKTLQITDPFNAANAQTCNFSQDDLARLASANCGTAWNQTFAFDPFGNISKSAAVGMSFQASYSPTTNHITMVGSVAPTYDANGNLTNDTSHSYSWDTDGNMLKIDSGTSGGVCDTYDALDRMVEKATGTSCTSSYTEIVYSPSGSRLAAMTGQTLQQASVPLLNGSEAVYTATGLLAYRHPDHLGSSRFASTSARTKYYDGAYAPYGEDYAESGTTDLSFTEQKEDSSSWLYDFHFRKYNTTQGRWMSPDPAGLAAIDPVIPQTWNRYSYALNNPLLYVDPLGLWCVFFADSALGGFTLYCSNDGSGENDRAKLPQSPNQREGNSCAAKRIAKGVQGVINIGLGELKTAGAVGVGLLGAGAAPETEGTSLAATLGAGYVAISSQGQVLTGQAQLYTMITGDFKTGEQIQQMGDIISGPLTGVPTLVVTQNPETAAMVANFESSVTLGAGAFNADSVADKIASAVDAGLIFVGLGQGSCEHQ